MKENEFEYVDLGLPSGTMWATYNVGADKPEDQGLLFQFGRVDGYKYGDKDNQFRTTKQNKQDTGDYHIPKTTSGKTYNDDEILDLEDDAAYVHMGGKWRMPTRDQIDELCRNTIHEVKTINGVQGMMFTSPINWHHLFIPFMQGCWYNGKWKNWDKSYALMWSSQVRAHNVLVAYTLSCDYTEYANGDLYSRFYTCYVRGVFKK